MRIGSPQSFNRYAYVQNDPVNFVDPTGLDEEPPDGPLDTIVTNTSDRRPGSSVGGIGDDTGIVIVDGGETNPGAVPGGELPQNTSAGTMVKTRKP